jgi:hypothetical protein
MEQSRDVRFGLIALTVLGGVACTTLGPMPATTAVTAMAPGRPDLEIQLGAVPGYYLSSAVQKTPKGAAIQQLSAVFDPDDWIAVPGIIAGARVVGSEDSGTYGEPMLGYRRALGDERRVGLLGIAYGTYAKDSRKGASYSAVRLGAEVGTDVRLTPTSKWLELHALADLSMTRIDARGRYCLDADGIYGVDCSDPPQNLTSATAEGVYSGLTVGMGLDTARGVPSVFHGVRLALYGGAGTLPRVVRGEQTTPKLYTSAGISLGVALGSSKAPD